MSMWEFESLVEQGIQLVDKIDTTNEKKIQLIGNLYAIQEQYDCSFTNFRVMPILLKTRYTKKIELNEHPAYEDNKAYFDGLLEKKGTEFINKDITKKWHPKTNNTVAYYNSTDKKIYVDFGSPLRKDEPALERMNVYDLGLYLIREADKLKDKVPVYDWAAYLVAFGDDLDQEELIEKYFREIKEIWSKYDYSDYEPIHNTLTLSRESLDDDEDWKDSFDEGRDVVLDFFFGEQEEE